MLTDTTCCQSAIQEGIRSAYGWKDSDPNLAMLLAGDYQDPENWSYDASAGHCVWTAPPAHLPYKDDSGAVVAITSPVTVASTACGPSPAPPPVPAGMQVSPNAGVMLGVGVGALALVWAITRYVV